MRILYIAHTTDWHGSSIALYNLIMSLRERHDIHVLLPKKEGLLYDKLKELGISIHNFDYRMHIVNAHSRISKQIIQLLKAILINNKAKKLFNNLLDEIKPDIVHCNVGPLSFASDICKEKKIPHVWHIREYQDKDFGLRFIPSKKTFIKKLSNPNNTAIAITQDIFRYWHLNPKKDRVIYDGVFTQNGQLPATNKKKQFLFVGRVDISKGTLEVIEAFNIFSKDCKGYKLLIAGSFMPEKNSYAKKCLDYVRNNCLEDNILFLGERNNIYQLMASSEALVVASRSEGFGFITVEGMLNKALVIGKNSSGTKEQFDNGVKWTGKEIGIRYTTKDELIRAMLNVSTLSYNQLRERAFNVVWNHYSIERHSKEIEQLYLDIKKV